MGDRVRDCHALAAADYQVNRGLPAADWPDVGVLGAESGQDVVAEGGVPERPLDLDGVG
jgi:hypothetical protein